MKEMILARVFSIIFYSLTITTIKKLLPVYDKNVIYYPLLTFMLAGIKGGIIISISTGLLNVEWFLGDDSKCGINPSCRVQPNPVGLV